MKRNLRHCCFLCFCELEREIFARECNRCCFAGFEFDVDFGRFEPTAVVSVFAANYTILCRIIQEHEAHFCAKFIRTIFSQQYQKNENE